MNDPNEVQVSKLAKKLLSAPPKMRDDSNLKSLKRIQQDACTECADEEPRP